MPGGILQEREPAVRTIRRLESGQDTAEYVLIIILLALAFTSGMMVWAKSVQGGYQGGADCIASSAGRNSGSGVPCRRP